MSRRSLPVRAERAARRGLCSSLHGKRRYQTIDDAWIAAWRLFAERGDAVTPFFCQPLRIMRSEVVVFPHPNPWAFKGWWSRRVKRCLRQRETCGGWHLSRNVASILTGATGEPVTARAETDDQEAEVTHERK